MGKKREREQAEKGGGGEGREESEGQAAKKAKVEDSTSASEVEEEDTGWVKQQREEREKMQLLVSAFSNSQQDQYEVFRRSSFPKSGVRRIMQGVCGTAVSQNAVIAMAGITKVYVGEIVEAALQAREDMREEGPLQPKHIREAVRRMKNKKKIPNARYKKSCLL